MTHVKEDEGRSMEKNVFITRVLWIFGVIGAVFAVLFLIIGLSIWFVLWVVLWISFIVFLYKRRYVAHIAQGTVIGLGAGLVLISLVLFDVSMPTAQEMQEEHDRLIEESEKVIDDNAAKGDAMDDVAIFIQDILSSIGETSGAISPDDQVMWTAKNMSLKPQNAHSTTLPTSSDAVWSGAQQYIISQGADHGTIGFTFEDRSPHEQVGYIIEEGKYTGLMCILTRDDTQITIGCGWGPGGKM